MSEEERNLRNLVLAPWILRATSLIGVVRFVGGNIFRHQMATLAILLDYKYFHNSILLKSACIHDLLEDIPNTDEDELRSIDSEANAVVDLVLEVTRRQDENKPEYLQRVLEEGSFNAHILKVADRISNLTDMNSDIYTQSEIKKYLDETQEFVLPMAWRVNNHMVKELTDLIKKRKELLD
jgi:(p)ppGpp synthase/HD superfamily hydrolase